MACSITTHFTTSNVTMVVQEMHLFHQYQSTIKWTNTNSTTSNKAHLFGQASSKMSNMLESANFGKIRASKQEWESFSGAFCAEHNSAT